MPNWNDSTHWNSGAHWPPAPSPRKNTKMANIAINTSKLPIPGKVDKGQQIITMSTGNPNVPGNTAVLAAFSDLQADLVAANEAHSNAQRTVDGLMASRDAALVAWNNGLTTLAAFTQIATQGDEPKILSTGFEVRRAPTPPPPASAPGPLTVKLNGSPGVTKLSWPPVPDAKSYLVEQSPDPVTDTSWAQVDTPTKASCELDGADPGKVYWYRVAAVSPSGAGPWSGPASRPVM